MILGVAARAARDDHVVARLQRFAIHLAGKLRRSSPLDDVAGLRPILLGHIDVNE